MADLEYKFLARSPQEKQLQFVLENERFISEKAVEIKVRIFPTEGAAVPFSGELICEIKTAGFYYFENGSTVMSQSFENKTNPFAAGFSARAVIRDDVDGVPDLPLKLFVEVKDQYGITWPNTPGKGIYDWHPVLGMDVVARAVSNLSVLK